MSYFFRADFWAYASHLAINSGIFRANGNCTGGPTCQVIFQNGAGKEERKKL